MNNLRELYQDVILEHGRHPRNFKKLTDANHEAEGFNPLCGDQLQLFIKTNNADIIEDISFQGCGCAISVASASLMTEYLKGKPIDEALGIFKQFHDALTQEDKSATEELKNSGKLFVLVGVREFPARVKCATLAWHTLKNALEDKSGIATTE